MKIIGLTGSIAMGKSLASKFLQRLHIPVIDLDKIVHELYRDHQMLISFIDQEFPGSSVDGTIDRKKLTQYVVGHPDNLARLEIMLEPFLMQRVKEFIASCRRKGQKIIILEVPLLFEKGYDIFCDAVIVVSAAPYLQKKRALRRNKMSLDKFNKINALQMPDRQKQLMSDYVIRSGLHKGEIYRQLHTILKDIY